ncbi:hypothetical protein SAMN04490357_0562 [Streptomyces misionensis]|uniref:Uncharacterized protein n=1 Tax=Streptomyces misionensis TaxID=67331 RepID=A0A1H4MRY5_9ACTN|nr:hypothetical protein SAMN04490357_0562 [Streptomyces misionensis]
MSAASEEANGGEHRPGRCRGGTADGHGAVLLPREPVGRPAGAVPRGRPERGGVPPGAVAPRPGGQGMAGDLLVVPPARHGLAALDGSAVLLTVVKTA